MPEDCEEDPLMSYKELELDETAFVLIVTEMSHIYIFSLRDLQKNNSKTPFIMCLKPYYASIHNIV